jgi:two-component system, response regulator RegA
MTLNLPTDASLLVVDDDATFAERLGTALAKQGFTVRVETSVTAARQAIRAEPPRFAVFDLRLRDGSGLDLISELLAARPTARPIILSGYGNIATAVSAAKRGAFDYLPKPSDADDIAAALLAPANGFAAPPEAPSSPRDVRLAHIRNVLAECNNNLSVAARQLNMHRRTLQRIVRRDDFSALQ